MKLSQLCSAVKIEFFGQEYEIVGANTLSLASRHEISFLDNPKYIKELSTTKAAAVLLKGEYAAQLPKGCIPLVTNEPYLSLAHISKLFAKPPFEIDGPSPIIDERAYIHPKASIGFGATVAAGAVIGAGCSVGDFASIGEDTVLYPNATVYRDCTVGARCILHSGCVIGSDGFGFAHTRMGEHVKIYQNGTVTIEDDVEIGANTTVDRAVFGTTLVKKGSKIDNLVQIAHNAVIGENSIMAAQSGVSGSTKLGRNVVMGGQSAAAGHLQIGDFATIAGRGGVTKNLDGGKTYAGFPLMEHREWLKMQAILSRLLKQTPSKTSN